MFCFVGVFIWLVLKDLGVWQVGLQDFNYRNPKNIGSKSSAALGGFCLR